MSGKAFAIRILLMLLGIDVGASAVKAVVLDGLKLIASKSEAPRSGGSWNIGGKPVVASCAAPSPAFAKFGEGRIIARLRHGTRLRF